jgi:hypothetical protein
MADILVNELTAILAREAQNLRTVATIAGDAKESQDFFETEMMLTGRDDDFGKPDDVGMTSSNAAVSRSVGPANARMQNRFDLSSAWLLEESRLSALDINSVHAHQSRGH